MLIKIEQATNQTEISAAELEKTKILISDLKISLKKSQDQESQTKLDAKRHYDSFQVCSADIKLWFLITLIENYSVLVIL